MNAPPRTTRGADAVALAAVSGVVGVRPHEARRPLPDVAREVEVAERPRPGEPPADRASVGRLEHGVAGRRRASPHGQVRRSPPRAARSHCASVGRKPPAQRQNASASAQVTYVTGWSSRRAAPSRSATPRPAGRPVACTKAPYCAFVTGVRPSRKAARRRRDWVPRPDRGRAPRRGRCPSRTARRGRGASRARSLRSPRDHGEDDVRRMLRVGVHGLLGDDRGCGDPSARRCSGSRPAAASSTRRRRGGSGGRRRTGCSSAAA